MSIIAKLFFCSEERELSHTNLDYHRFTRFNGKPSSGIIGGYLTVTFTSEMYDDSFLSAIIADRSDKKNIEYPFNLYELHDGKIVFYKDEIDGQRLFEYSFKDAVIIEYKETFDNQAGMQVTLTISPAIQDYRLFNESQWDEKSPTRLIKPWQENYIPPSKKTGYTPTENNTEEKKEITEGIWLDTKGNTLTTENGFTKKLAFGEKVKIKLIANDKTLNEEVKVTVKAKIGNTEQQLSDNGKPTTFNVNLENGEGISSPFLIDVDWYNEIDEEYSYTNHQTTIQPDKALTFIFETTFKGQTKEFPEKNSQKLVPVTYRRNYEELIGLFNTDDSGKKHQETNYENKFINSNSAIKGIVDAFVKKVSEQNTTISEIKTLVNEKATALWGAAVQQVQGGKLDDRPLYWARNKMQTWLKRNPLFKDQIDFEKSTVKKGTELENTITLFEEKSRNYTGVDFSKAGKKKKVLITGFDPFLLNSFDHKYSKYYNILQSNPSGVVALSLNNDNTLGAFIQTMVVPVRYTDFDGKQDNKVGQGEGIIEKYIKRFISQVDMIITISQAGPDDYHIDVFATATRGGGDENMNFTRAKNKAVNNFCPETIKTTLPIQMTQGKSKAIYWGEYFVTEQDEKEFYRNRDFSKKKHSNTVNYPRNKVYSGPGGNYLSNEIFYRVAKMRNELKPTLKTGHFHISKIQDAMVKEDLDPTEIKDVLDTVKQTLLNGIKGI